MIKLSKQTSTRRFLWVSIGLLLGHFLGLSAAYSDQGAMPQLAPLNPAFVERLQPGLVERLQPGLMVQRSAPAESQRALGYVPSPVDLSHLTVWDGNRLFRSSVRVQQLPARYDLREQGRVTPARDQANCGACWAFATMGSIESNLLPHEDRDFSENHMKNTSGFQKDPCAGGNYFMSTAYLARWSGPVSEADDPYAAGNATSPSGLTAQKHVQSVWVIPDRSPGTADNAAIKQAVRDHGAVSTAMYWDHTRYRDATKAYYYNGNANANHGVLIVGWDDDFPAGAFNTTPPGNGAFIIQNSWGEFWGEGGHFYISYYDTLIGQHNFLFNRADPPSLYNVIYQYDPLGWTSVTGYGSDTAWGANIFTARDHEIISAIGFYTTAANATYTAYIYSNVASGPRSGVLAAGPVTGGFTFAGYHTVVLPEPVSVAADEQFSVVLKITTPGHTYPLAIETPVTNYSAPTAGPGESYMSINGTHWSDTTTALAPHTNVCIKAFGQSGNADLALSKTAGSATATVGNKLVYTITVTNNGPSSAAGVTVIDALPGGLDPVSATPSQGTCSGQAEISCALGSIDSGGAAAITLVVKPNTTGSITNSATVEAANDDPEPSNDTDAAVVQVSHAVPHIDSLNPEEVIVGNTGVTVMVYGTGFAPASRVRIDGVDRSTTFVSYEQLATPLEAADNAHIGSVNVSVFNPSSGGGHSNDAPLAVVDPPPTSSNLPTSGGGTGEGGGGGGCFISAASLNSPF